MKTKSECVAGLDLSLTSAGVAIIDKDDSVYCYSFGYKLKKGCPEGNRIARMVYVANSVMGVLLKHKVRHVGFENYGFGGHGLAIQADLGGVIKSQVYVGLKSVPILLPATTIRKYLLGTAKKDKRDVDKFLRSIGYSQPTNLDESDALAVAVIVRDWACGRDEPTNEYQQEVMDKIEFNVSVEKVEVKK